MREDSSVGHLRNAIFQEQAALTMMGKPRSKVPDFPNQITRETMPIFHILMLPGLRSVLAATLLFVLVHNDLDSYIAT